MYFLHTPDIWREFPQLVPGLLLVEGVDPSADVAARLEPLHRRAAERLSAGAESDLPEVQAWRRAYAQMGMKPTQYRNPGGPDDRNRAHGGELPRLHPLVDLCNAVSLAFALPVAVFDLDEVAGFIEVRHASGTERYLAFSGEVEAPAPGEVIFADADEQVHARRWTFRQSRRSTVGPATRRALIVSEGLHPTAAADVPALIAALDAEIAAIGYVPAGRAVLTAESPRWELPIS